MYEEDKKTIDVDIAILSTSDHNKFYIQIDTDNTNKEIMNSNNIYCISLH